MERRSNDSRPEVIEVILGHDGVAQAIKVRADDVYRLPGDTIGQLVVEADRDAARRLAEAMFADFEQSNDGHVEVGAAGSGLAPTSLADPAVPASDPSTSGQVRPVGELLTSAVQAFDRLATTATPGAPTTGGDGPIRLTMTYDRITACAIEPGWLEHADNYQLASALQRALGSVLTARADAQRPASSLAFDAKALLADVQATLRSIAAVVA